MKQEAMRLQSFSQYLNDLLDEGQTFVTKDAAAIFNICIIHENKITKKRLVVRHRYSNPMIQPESEGSTQGYPLVSVEVLRYDKRSKSKNMKIVPTEMELILEHTQQGISHEFSISAEGVEE
nr:hypothetical protein [Tanacetum cinerariifolium]